MAVDLVTADEVQAYMQDMVGRAECHGRHIVDLVPTILLAAFTAKDPGTPFRVMTRAGHTTIAFWVHIAGRRYAVSYREPHVVVCDGRFGGRLRVAFGATTTPRQVRRFFAALRGGTAPCAAHAA